jgi:uncharacterized protein YukE
VVEDGGAPIHNAGEFALETYRQESGMGWLLGGLLDLTAATKAFAAANEARALSIDPHAIDSMLAKLTGMQRELEAAANRSSQIATATPLGGGYAEYVGQVNRDVGREVLTRIIPELSRAFDDLKAEIEKSRASYRTVDDAHQGTMNNIQGRMQP